MQADTVVPEPGNPQALNRYAYVLNNPLRYVDPTGLFSEEEIMKYLGVDTWEEVLAFFREGGLLAGRWGWLAVLRQVQLGDEIQFLEGYTGIWPAPGPGARIALRGTFVASNNSLYVQDPVGGLIAADAAAKVGNAYLLARPSSEPRLPTLFGPYYANEIYLQPKLDPSRIDWTEAGIDVFGLVGEAVKGVHPIGTGVWGASKLASIYGYARAGRQAVYGGDWGPLSIQVAAEAIEAVGNTADVIRLSPIGGYIGNLISLGVNLCSIVSWTP